MSDFRLLSIDSFDWIVDCQNLSQIALTSTQLYLG